MRRWRRLLIAIALFALTWQGWKWWKWYVQWKYSIRFTFRDGSPAAFAYASIWVDGWSLPINHQGGGWLSFGKSIWPPSADKRGVYRLSRGRVNSAGGLYIAAEAWKDGRKHAAWVRLDPAEEAPWPIRLTLNPIR